MRPGQQHNRRNNRNNRHQNGGGGGGGHGQGGQRKHQNPLTRSYESNGPDVKVRGTPMHIAEKYMSLARDAQSAGDPVLAENYLQHAEHYNRIIMAYREQQEAGGQQQQPQRFRQPGFDPNDPGDDFGDDLQLDGPAGEEPQPVMGGGDQPGERPMEQRQERSDRPERQDRFDRGDRGFQDRGPDRGPDRTQGLDRGPDRSQDRGERPFNRFDGDRPNRDHRENGQGENRQGDNRQFRRDRFNNDRNDRGNRYQGDRRDRFNEGGQRSFEPRADGEPRTDRGDRPGSDRGPRDRGDRDQRGDRFDRGTDRQSKPERAPDANGMPPHERHVPERRQPSPVVDQPAPEWVAQDRPPVQAEPFERAPVVERPIERPSERPVERAERPIERAPEPARVAPVAAVDATPAAERPARAAPRRRAPPAAPAGAAFQEHDQPSFLKRSTRKPKAEPKAETEPKPE